MKNNTFIFQCQTIKEKTGYTSLCIDCDVASEGETIEESQKNLQEALSLYIESAVENNLPVIRSIPLDENPLNTRKEDIVNYFDLKINLHVEVNA